MIDNKNYLFTGVCTALITPFKNGKIDYSSLKKLIEFQISQGVDALLVNGTTGENAVLDDKEVRELISFAISEVGQRVPVVAGTGSNSTEKAIKLTQFAQEVGADAALVVTPYYNKATSEGLKRHYLSIADKTDVPLILYNVPSRTGVNIPIDVYGELSKCESIIGVKEANSSIGHFAHLAMECREKVALYSGNDDLIVPTLSLGGSGVISVLSNALPKEVGAICRSFFERRIKEASELQLKLLPLVDAIFSEVNPIPIKALLSYLGFCEEEYRLPLCPMNDEKKKVLLTAFENFKF